ncbi:MAG: hypothetical protein P1U34_08620 [Coxiellaceae bacterium]|nr:hypothetical protein [Coxiellaceae bacterium]
MSRGGANLNEEVRTNDVVEHPREVGCDSPRLFKGALSESKRFECAIVALKRNFHCLSLGGASVADVKLQVGALIGKRGFFAEFVHGNSQLPLKRSDVLMQYLSTSFMYLLTLAMEMVSIKVIPAKKIAIIACDFAKHSALPVGTIHAVTETIVNTYSRRGVNVHHRHLFQQIMNRLKKEELVGKAYKATIPDSLERCDGATEYRRDTYFDSETWGDDGEEAEGYHAEAMTHGGGAFSP